MSHGGIPFELVFKQRKKNRPKLVILCDVSSSVSNVSRFMLQFVYSLQEAFTKIRAFVFVAELGEVTQVMQEGEIGQAIENALAGGECSIPTLSAITGLDVRVVKQTLQELRSVRRLRGRVKWHGGLAQRRSSRTRALLTAARPDIGDDRS